MCGTCQIGEETGSTGQIGQDTESRTAAWSRNTRQGAKISAADWVGGKVSVALGELICSMPAKAVLL